MVHYPGLGDTVEPGGERYATVSEPFQALQSLKENLSRQVFGYIHIAHTVIDVAVDVLDMTLIELADSFLVVSLGLLNQKGFVVVHLKTPLHRMVVFSCIYYTAKARKGILQQHKTAVVLWS